MWISRPVYDALPVAYVISGTVVMACFGNIYGLGSGALLALAGIITWRLRGNVAATSRTAPVRAVKRVSRLRSERAC